MTTLGQLLSEHKYLKLQPNNKILCDVTGHEMSARADVVQGYISGKSFKKQLEWYTHDYTEFLPYIVEDRRNKKQLFCKLTRQPLNKIPAEVRKHMQGKRFKRLLIEKEASLKEQSEKALSGKKNGKKQEESEDDDEDSLDPRIVKELLGGEEDEEEEVSNKRAKKGSTKRKADEEEEEEEEDFADLLGDHSDMDGSDVSSDEEEGAEDFLGSEDGSIDSEEEQIIRKSAVKQVSQGSKGSEKKAAKGKAAPVKSVTAKKAAPVAKAVKSKPVASKKK